MHCAKRIAGIAAVAIATATFAEDQSADVATVPAAANRPDAGESVQPASNVPARPLSVDPPPRPLDTPPSVPSEPATALDRRVGPFTADAYPSEGIYRPLTLPARMLRIAVAGRLDWTRPTAPTIWNAGFSAAADYGLGDRLQLSAQVSTATGGAAAPNGVGVRYLWIDGDRLDLAAEANAEVAFTGGPLNPTLVLGVPTRLLLSNAVFLTAGDGLIRVAQLSLPFPSVALNVGVGVQAHSAVFFEVGTNLVPLGSNLFGSVSSLFSGLFTAPAIPIRGRATVALLKGFDLQLQILMSNLLNPRSLGALTAGCAGYF